MNQTPSVDAKAAKSWIYPTNYPIRKYQQEISEQALFNNTLVCLPTGLGKTLIASVVIYNYYRWFPKGILLPNSSFLTIYLCRYRQNFVHGTDSSLGQPADECLHGHHEYPDRRHRLIGRINIC
jgi:hypothetical protein